MSALEELRQSVSGGMGHMMSPQRLTNANTSCADLFLSEGDNPLPASLRRIVTQADRHLFRAFGMECCADRPRQAVRM